LTSVALPGSGGTVNFKYDSFGRRIYKSWSSGTSVYAYDGDTIVDETNSTGATSVRYAQGLDIDEPLAILQGTSVNYYQADSLGSITSLTNASGVSTETYAYDAFGNLTALTGSVGNRYRYTGREFDSETNLYFYRARYL
jgi:YD repeat-containing protein